MVVVVVMAVNTVVDHLDELFFEKQLLLDGHVYKPYSVAHVKKHGWTVAHLTICVGRACGICYVGLETNQTI